jgi:pimeloyl-ACP methyl ester carboxylesterase
MSDTGFRDFYYESADGLRLHARIYGERRRDRLAVVCLPGLTRNARDFHRLALFLSAEAKPRRQVIAFDYRGRGQSAYDSNWQNYTVGTELADVMLGLDALDIARALFIGTSRGGLIVQVLAAFKPNLIAAAVLNDIGPVVERQGLDVIRRYLSNPAEVASLAEAIEAQRKVHGHAFPALAEEDWAAMVDALYRVDNGLPVADFDPALVKTLMSADPDQPLPQLWQEFEALAQKPVLAIRGDNSLLLSEATLAEMAKRSATVETITVTGQGHPPLLETGELPARIAEFFERAERAVA